MKINHFGLFWSIFICAYMSFIVTGHSGQNHKKADLSLKIDFFQSFRSRFGFLVQFYPYPELEIKNICPGSRFINFWSFFEKLAHCALIERFQTFFFNVLVFLFSAKYGLIINSKIANQTIFTNLQVFRIKL
jgi:hypothetical protein